MSEPLRVRVVAPSRLSDEHVALWHRLMATEFDVRSPFLTPEYVRLVARVRDDVEVGVLERGEAVGFFPFQRKGETAAGPVGGRLSDLQAVIAPRDLDWRSEDLLLGCGLTTWDFDHLLASQAAWRPYQYAIEPSPYLDLSQGFAVYCEERKRAGSEKIGKILRKRRQLDREYGPLRFEPHVADERVFELLLRWKSEQYVRTGLADVFAEAWTRRLLAALFSERTEHLAGMMPVLYAAGQPVAINLGMRSGQTFHSWFIAYDRRYARFSPGHALTITVAEHCDSLGIDRYELGKGPEDYKVSLASGAYSVAEGSADLRPVASRLRRGWDGTRRWVRAGPLGPSAQRAVRFARTLGRSLASF